MYKRQLFGFCSIAIGVNSIIKASGMTAVVLAILVGFTIGHLLHLEQWTSKFFHNLVRVLHLGGEDIDMEFYLSLIHIYRGTAAHDTRWVCGAVWSENVH